MLISARAHRVGQGERRLHRLLLGHEPGLIGLHAGGAVGLAERHRGDGAAGQGQAQGQGQGGSVKRRDGTCSCGFPGQVVFDGGFSRLSGARRGRRARAAPGAAPGPAPCRGGQLSASDGRPWRRSPLLLQVAARLGPADPQGEDGARLLAGAVTRNHPNRQLAAEAGGGVPRKRPVSGSNDSQAGSGRPSASRAPTPPAPCHRVPRRWRWQLKATLSPPGRTAWAVHSARSGHSTRPRRSRQTRCCPVARIGRRRRWRWRWWQRWQRRRRQGNRVAGRRRWRGGGGAGGGGGGGGGGGAAVAGAGAGVAAHRCAR